MDPLSGDYLDALVERKIIIYIIYSVGRVDAFSDSINRYHLKQAGVEVLLTKTYQFILRNQTLS